MITLHKKKAVVVLVLSTVTLLSVAAFTPEQQQQQPRKKNLKVLPQNISRDSLNRVMHEYNDALGVKCGFCHAAREGNPSQMDFSSDAKPEKETTREMMRMTMELNRKYFTPGGDSTKVINAVSCNTCHRGAEHPL
jgi:predicted metal-binding protein